MSPERRALARAYASPGTTPSVWQRYLNEALDEVERLEGELAAVKAERDEMIVTGALAGTVQMGPADRMERPSRRRRR